MRPRSLNSIPISIKIKWELCELHGAEVFVVFSPAFWFKIKGTRVNIKMYLSVLSTIIPSFIKYVLNVQLIANAIFTQTEEQQVFPLVNEVLILKFNQEVQLELLHDHVKFHPDQLRGVQEMKQQGLPLPLTPPPAAWKRHREWERTFRVKATQGFTMVKVYSAYSRDEYERI